MRIESVDILHGPLLNQLKKSPRKGLSDIQYNFLLNLNIEESQWDDFLTADFEKTHSPFLLPDIFGAITILRKAIREKKHILLYGDRDTDGVSSTSLLAIYFRNLISNYGGKLSVKTSSENDDYGLCSTVTKKILDLSPDILITLDFGTSNFDEINFLAQKNITVIVLDHHEIPIRIPECKLINPKREDSKYPEKRICTSVLAMKLILALKCAEIFETEMNDGTLFFDYNTLDYKNIDYINYLKKYPELIQYAKNLLDLSSVGTVTDMMPLIGENRIIVKNGMSTFERVLAEKQPSRLGLRALMVKAEVRPKKILSKDLGWTIGPILNAAGRMGKTEAALSLLLTDTEVLAEKHSNELIELNKERKERTKRNIYRTEEYFKRKPERTQRKIIFCYEPDMEPGVSGIVATRLVEKYKKPVVFLTPDHGKARGSVRSFGSENVIELMNLVAPLLEHYGGHPEAGGFSIELSKISDLEIRLQEVEDLWLGSLEIDVASKSSIFSLLPQDLTESLYNELSIFEPFGQGNPVPLLSVREAKLTSFKPMGDGSHARFSIVGASSKIKGVVWRDADALHDLVSKKSTIDLWGTLEENYFRGVSNLQFVVSKFC